MNKQMKLLVVLALSVFVSITAITIGCDDDGGGAGCTDADVNKCIEDYTTCTSGINILADGGADDMATCLEAFCNCIDEGGCDLPDGYECSAE